MFRTPLWFLSFLGSPASPRHSAGLARRRAERRQVRPRVLALEDRLLPSVYWVTTTAGDDSAGSLHQAIHNADANPGSTIAFDIPSGFRQTITLTAPLPTIFAPTTIDGTTQPGWSRDPIITVANGLPQDSNGLTITADGCQVKGLVVQGFKRDGICVYSNNNVIADDWLEGNAVGVEIANAVSGNLIGGTTAVRRNVISGNGAYGVYIQESSTGNLVEGNYIGTTADGFAALANGFDGVGLFADNNTIGGTATGAGNLISGNTEGGISIIADANLVQGNKIGTNADGFSGAVPNGRNGIELNGSGNLIGGTAAGAGNLISGNSGDGINLDFASANVVQGNKIGTNRFGSTAVANGGSGIVLRAQSSSNTVGGTAPGAGNLISGNAGEGIFIQSLSTANLVQGNKIGTVPDGSYALANGQDGIEIQGAYSNTIGGAAAAAGNLISGNTKDGIRMDPDPVSHQPSVANLVQGNKIGTNAAGTAALANGSDGVGIAGSNNTVGGTAAGAGNLISGNSQNGIFIGVDANLVQGNKIGTNAAGTAAVANGKNGVDIAASNNTVGGTAAGAANTIAFNKANGVLVDSGSGNAIRHNSIFANGGLGIRLSPGANNNQPAPTLTSATYDGFMHVLTVHGTMTGAPGSQVTLEFFASPAGDPEGKVFLGFPGGHHRPRGQRQLYVHAPHDRGGPGHADHGHGDGPG